MERLSLEVCYFRMKKYFLKSSNYDHNNPLNKASRTIMLIFPIKYDSILNKSFVKALKLNPEACRTHMEHK